MEKYLELVGEGLTLLHLTITLCLEIRPDVYQATDIYFPKTKDIVYGAYGGNILAQAMKAALLTVTDSTAFVFSSVQCCYLSPATSKTLLYHVTREKDGRTLCYRSVRATQGDRIVCHCFVSFKLRDDGKDIFSHCSHPKPTVPDPEQSVSYLELKDSVFFRAILAQDNIFPLDMRVCNPAPWEYTGKMASFQDIPSLKPQ